MITVNDVKKRIVRWQYRNAKHSAWHELRKYGYNMENSQEPGAYLWRIVNALGEPVTEWERIVSTDDVIAARERFAEKELEEINAA